MFLLSASWRCETLSSPRTRCGHPADINLYRESLIYPHPALSLSVCLSVCLSLCACVCVRACARARARVCVCMCVCVCACVCVLKAGMIMIEGIQFPSCICLTYPAKYFLTYSAKYQKKQNRAANPFHFRPRKMIFSFHIHKLTSTDKHKLRHRQKDRYTDTHARCARAHTSTHVSARAACSPHTHTLFVFHSRDAWINSIIIMVRCSTDKLVICNARTARQAGVRVAHWTSGHAFMGKTGGQRSTDLLSDEKRS